MDGTQGQPKNYSYLALIIALVALTAALLLGITRLLVAMQVVTVASVEGLNQYIAISLGVAILSTALYAILEPKRVRHFFTGRRARYGSNALITTIAFLFILGLVNILFKDPQFNLDKTWDITENKTNTLAPETLAALQELPAPVKATAFFSQNSDIAAATELLNKIQNNSNGRFTYEFINPDLDPQAALNAGITGDGKILLELGDQSAIVAFASESEILKGLLRLLNPESSAIYFMTGHGERDTAQNGDTSMSRAVSTLESKNYSVKPLNLLVDNQIPEDAQVIVIAGPVKPISENEVKLLKEFLDNGGSLIFMGDPTFLTDYGDGTDPLADMLAEDWGITLNDDIVIDLNSAQPTIAAASYYDSAHPITLNMNNLVSFYPFSRSLGAAESSGEVTFSPIVQTNERSWGETDFTSITESGQVQPNEGETYGPLILALAAENSATNGRVVVFGTSEFATDQIFDSYGNGDMFVNSVDWSAEQENLASITPKNTTERTFTPPSQMYWILILLTSIFIIPGLVVLGGVSTWLARRRQG